MDQLSPEELLIELQSSWEIFLTEDFTDKKEFALMVFLHKAQFVQLGASSDESQAVTTFINSVAPQVYNYLLERVYKILCQLKVNGPEVTLTRNNKITSFQGNSDAITFMSGAEVNIYTLRAFLLFEIGHHILYFLRRVNVKLLTTHISLCVLCIQTFPEGKWDGEKVELCTDYSLGKFINSLYLYNREHMNQLEEIQSSNSMPIECNTYIEESPIVDFKEFVKKSRSSDEIAVVLIDLLGKCVDNAIESMHVDKSTSVICWEFAMKNISIDESKFASKKNCDVVKLKLLSLIAKCFNHISWKENELSTSSLRNTMDYLTLALNNTTDTQVISGVVYLVFGILNNVIAFADKKLHDALKFVDEESLDKCIIALTALLVDPNCEIVPYFFMVVKILLQIIDNLCKIPLRKGKRSRKKTKDLLQQHCRRTNFPCFFQKMLICMVESLPSNLQEYVLRCLLRHGICCCLCNIDTMKVLFSKHIIKWNRKLALDFVQKRIFTSIFIRSNCSSCELKLKSVEFHGKIIKLYIKLYLDMNDMDDYYCLLKHLKRIANLVSHGILNNILACIVLPLFRKYKQLSNIEDLDFIIDCLNIFISYLKDVETIKSFYNDENITHLEELMHQPELTRYVCDLIKIGIHNGGFLGENLKQQAMLFKRLMMVQFNGTLTADMWVNALMRYLDYDDMFWLDLSDEILHSDKLSALQVLHIASRHWCLNYHLFKSNSQYRTLFCSRMDSTALLRLMCNVLSCFLFFSKYECDTVSLLQERTPDEEQLKSIFSDTIIMPSVVRKSCLVSLESSAYNDIIKNYVGHSCKHQWSVETKSTVLFDARYHGMLVSPDETCTHQNNLQIVVERPSSAENQKSILGRIFNYFFGSSSQSTSYKYEKYYREQQLYTRCLYQPGEGKILLLTLFEAVLSVYLGMANEREDSDAMHKSLRTLKLVILARALQEWDQLDTMTSAVSLALQSLMKIAELTMLFPKDDSCTTVSRDSGSGGVMPVINADEPTLASTESDGDYYSTRASLICADSEIDMSENETEEFYLTADEGYEADGEIPGMSESEEEIEELWSSYTPTSRYRTHVVHSGICKIVVDVLVELSMKCVEKPSSAWANSLSQLAARMFVIRDLLGGPLFLLQGFAPLLKSNNVHLRELQQSILDLVLDMDTPDILSAFFGILASKNPPIDILVKYMSYICTNTLVKQPSIELEFPTGNNGRCISSSDPLIAEQIERVRSYHLHETENTSFVRSPCVLPITHGKVWSNDGVTVSIWLQMKSGPSHKTFGAMADDETKNSSDENTLTHLFSIGSNQAIISVFINSNMNLYFEANQPNAALGPRAPDSDDNRQSDINRNKENIPINPAVGVSPLRMALKQTKKVLLNSFTYMHLFHQGASLGFFEGPRVELKYFRLNKAKWTHLCVAIDPAPDRFNLTVTIDGLEQHAISLPFRNLRNVTKIMTYQLLSLGDSVPKLNANQSRSTLDGVTTAPYKYSISNVMVFNRKIVDREIVLNLTAMGPDFIDLTPCLVGTWKPNFGYLNLSKWFNANVGNFHEAMKLLRDSRLLTYSASDPTLMMGFDRVSDGEYNIGKNYGVMIYGDVIRHVLPSIQASTMLCGGLSNFLYFFARTVELTTDSTTQSLALDSLLTVALSNSQLYTEFVRNDYLSLIGYVIKTDRCTKDVFLLASILSNACTQPIIMKKASVLQVNENTMACVAYPILIVNLIHRYSDWQRSGSESCEVLEMIFKAILALVRDKHPCKELNMKQLNRVGLVKELLNLCKVYVVEAPNPVHISVHAAELFVNILSVFSGTPPIASMMDEIMKLLLLLHKPSECFVTHDRSKFYFLLSTESPVKEKMSGLQTPRRQLKQIIRDRRHSFSANMLRITSARRTISKDSHLPIDDNPKYTRLLMDQHITGVNSLINDIASLESIADCSRLNKQSLKLISPSVSGKWRTKMKRRSVHQISRSSSINHLRAGICKGSRKSMRSTSDSEKRNRSDKSSATSPHSPTSDSQTCLNESVKWPFDKSIFAQKKSKALFKVDFYNSAGIIRLQEKLFILLKDFLSLLPDSVVEEVLTHYVKVEILLVLANHTSTAIRIAILKLLSALSKRISSNELGVFTKKFYPQHLANQLAIHVTDVQMFETCLEWVTGLYGNLEAFTKYECVTIQNRLGVNALLSLLTRITGQDESVAQAFKILRTIFLTDPDENNCLVDTGLLQCCMKCLLNLFMRATTWNQASEEAITELLTSIGEKALRSAGQINIIWDILNMLSFYQDGRQTGVVKGFRSVQGKLQFNWLNLFLRNQASTQSFKIVPLSNTNLTLSETKTRLDLLIDRCSQFFTSPSASQTPSENEIKLFELLVSLGVSNNTRYNNFIAWGLLPSRPHVLRQFIVNTLWVSCQNEVLPTNICDGKMIKYLLWSNLSNQKKNSDKPIENLDQLCLRLGIKDDTLCNSEYEVGRIESGLQNITPRHKSVLEKTVYKFESLAVSCIESSMIITRVVAELQNSERKVLMGHIKEYDENYTFHKWLEIIRRMTHEGAPWFSSDRCETSFELDDTEGPSRVHTRLRRCHLDIDKRFIMEEYRKSGSRCDDYIRPLDYLISSYDQQLNISLNCQILYNFPAKYLPVDAEIDGEIIVTDHKLYFIATYRCKYFYVSCDIANITEIWLKRYQHQEKAFEIFLDTNKSLFFSLQNQDDWKIMKDVFLDKIVTSPDQNKITLITQQWREGLLTNWEYIMTLNQIAGRTYNDLMQYPVFPWILSNYTSDVLDLTDKTNFRKLEKPIAVQHEENEQHYVNNYTYINNTMTNMGTLQLKPYHYSSHYSNSGTVLHFLVRVPPFTSYFLRYQDNNFDLPDRTFHALSTTWGLASKDSPTDVKELIPEFFCLPEMFENFERFDFGCRQSGERVEDVLLPPWCLHNPRMFILIHRQALESELVRQNIHHWIDLIFGFNQTGQNAVDAINVFHPATYSVFLESEITDPIERKAVETMVKTYGQMPRQLFKTAHPSSKSLSYSFGSREVMPTVKGLRWGVFLGSPQLPKPTLGNICKLPGADFLVSFNNTNMVYALSAKSCVMQGPESDTYNVITWNYSNRIVCIHSLSDSHAKPKALLYNSPFDDITCCGSDPNSSLLWCGHKSGRISVYKCSSLDPTRIAKSRQSYVKGIKLSYNSAFRKISPKSNVKAEDLDQGEEISRNTIGTELTWSGPTILIRHTDEITSICLSVEFKIAVSSGRDGIAVIWDLNDLSYVRTIERPAEIHHSPITLTAISPTLGDIVTVHSITKSNTINDILSASAQADECFEVTEENLDDFVNVSINPNGKSILRLHSVNARYVNHIVHEDNILSVCYSYIKEGVGVNVIATAVEGGIIRLWSSWNLSFVTELVTGLSDIKSITYSTHQHLVVLTKDSYIQVWEAEGLSGNSPKFPQIVFK